MSGASRILVTGATGRTGRLVVAQLAAIPERYHLRVLVRTPEQAASFEQQGIEVAFGDASDAATSWADAAVRDVQAVISTMGGMPLRANNVWRVDYEGTQRLVAAARLAELEHYIFVSTMGLRRQRSILYPMSILFYPKLLAEDVIRRSELRYTILRPGGLVETPQPIGTRNTRAQVAAACIASLERPDTWNKTFEMAAVRQAEPSADPLFGLAVDV